MEVSKPPEYAKQTFPFDITILLWLVLVKLLSYGNIPTRIKGWGKQWQDVTLWVYLIQVHKARHDSARIFFSDKFFCDSSIFRRKNEAEGVTDKAKDRKKESNQ